jgi:signal transduction histidine kinase
VLDITWSIVGRKVRFVFRDYGIGVPPGDVSSLFVEGFRGREAARILRGNGLGLYLSQQHARRAKGDLFYEHPPDDEGGAMFILDLPYRSFAS